MDVEPASDEMGKVDLSVDDEVQEGVLSVAADSLIADAPLTRELRAGLEAISDSDEYPKKLRLPVIGLKVLGVRVVPAEIAANSSMNDPNRLRAAHDIARVIGRYTGLAIDAEDLSSERRSN